mgnify:FL=1
MATDAIKVGIDVETRQAIRALADVAKGLKDTEEGAKKSEGAFSRFRGALNEGSDTAERWHSNISSAVSVLAEFTAATAAGAAAHEQHERALRNLGSAYDAVQRQTQGAIDAESALRMQQTLTQSGLRLNSEEMGAAARAARDYALATGTETSEALGQLTDALVGAEAEGLRRFGVTVDATKTRSENFRSALQQLERQQRGMAPAAQTMAEANAQLSRSWSELSNSLFSDLARWADLQSNIAGVSDALRTLREAHGDLSSLVAGGAEGTQVAAAAANDNARLALRAEYDRMADRIRSEVPANMQDRVNFAPSRALNDAQLRSFISRAQQSGTWGQTYDDFVNFASETRGVREESEAARARVGAARNARLAAEQRAREEADRAQAAQERAQSASPAQYDATRFELADAINAFFDRLQASGMGTPTRARATYGSSLAELADLQSAQSGLLSGFGVRTAGRRPGEDLATYLQRSLAANDTGLGALVDQRTGKDNARYELGVAVAANERELALTRRAMQLGNADTDEGLRGKANDARQREEEIARRGNIGAQFRDAFIPAAEQTKTAAEMMAEGVKGAFDAMTGAVTNHVAAIIEGRESIGEALRGIAHDTLLSLAQTATKEALMETARGTAKLAASYGADPTAYGHFAAAGIYAAVAVGAGLGAYATGAPSASAASGGAGRTPPAAASAGVGSGQQGGGGNTYLINVNGTVMDREGTANAVLEAVNDAVGRGGVLRRAA